MYFNNFNSQCCSHSECQYCPYDVVCKSLHDLKSSLVPFDEMYHLTTSELNDIRLALISLQNALKDAGVELFREVTNNDHR